ncbi:glycosyltransferase family 2 protein [Sphingomonas sp. DG1-23]|uniref:glycosyltransferase family A protein n=1 Tax=Sphingomonas sp. DG1-23 TaxID=3068316 RepID=UPI00273D81E0|nr:glycosyltransferase family 2 protein [Sphingomonas sp. DG1-23]MDP5279846.1 glycosyltransferase family 2 protein [Sphingomonas sp. DG1-23]
MVRPSKMIASNQRAAAPPSPFKGWVTACIPHFDCQEYIGRAVESLLNQTYPWVRIIVINDGKERPPWDALRGFTDRRVLRFNLSQRAGPYFALEVARRASPDPFFLIQDADDWSDAARVEILLNALDTHKADFAVSAQPQFMQDACGKLTQTGVRWSTSNDGEWGEIYAINRNISENFLYRAPHHGLFRSDILRRIGGYYGGHMITWDTIVTNLIIMLGSVAWTPLPLYNRLIRPASLSHAENTGIDSEYQKKVHGGLTRLYDRIYADFRRFKRGRMPLSRLEERIRSLSGGCVPAAHRAALSEEAARLRNHVKEMHL